MCVALRVARERAEIRERERISDMALKDSIRFGMSRRSHRDVAFGSVETRIRSY